MTTARWYPTTKSLTEITEIAHRMWDGKQIIAVEVYDAGGLMKASNGETYGRWLVGTHDDVMDVLETGDHREYQILITHGPDDEEETK